MPRRSTDLWLAIATLIVGLGIVPIAVITAVSLHLIH
jgi:hypothetical protein